MTATPSDVDTRDVIVRLARETDLPVIRQLFQQGMIERQLRDNDTGADIENLSEAYFSDEGASGFWVACRRDQVIGMIGVQRTRAEEAEIRRLRVREDERRRGIGTLLLREATNFCRHHGYLKVVLDVRLERGPAIELFKKFGFMLGKTTVGEDGHTMLDFYMDLYTPRDRTRP